jgi:O-antigen ligase
MRYLLAFFFFLMYTGDSLGINMSLGPGLSTKNLLLYVILAGIAVNAAVARNRKIELTSVFVMFGLLILYAFITWVTLSFVLQDPGYEVKAGFVSLKSSLVDEFLTLVIFFYGLLYLKDAMWLLRAIIWIAMLGNLVTIIDTMNIPDLGVLPVPRKGGRFEGFIGQPNAYGQFLALFLPACITLFLHERGARRMLAGTGVFASLLALMLTASRGSYVALIGGAILGAFYLRQHISTQTVIRAGVAASVIGGVALAVTFATGYSDLFIDRFSSIEGNPHIATSGRTSIWSNALSSMMENPLSFVTGYGFYSYDSSRSFRLSTHNMYLSFLYNLGVIGLFLFVVMFTRIVAEARAAIARASDELRAHLIALVCGVFAFLVSLVFNDYHGLGYLLWAYVGIVMRAAMNTGYSDAAEPAPAEAHQPSAPREQAGERGTPGWAHGDIRLR